MKIYEEDEIKIWLEENSFEWDYEDQSLIKKFTFKDFVQAFEFMSQVATLAEEDHHHPNWTNNYSTVVLRWTTHDFGGITDRDLNIIKKVEALYKLQK